MNTDNFTAEKSSAALPLKGQKKPYGLTLIRIFPALACLAAAALSLFFFKNGVLLAAAGFLFAVLIAGAILTAAELGKTERRMKLFLEGNGSDPLRLIRLHYSPAAEQLLAERAAASRNVRQEENLRKAQYLALQNQINPHFLYNTLEAIRSEALIGGLSTIADMSETLANFFRYTISNTSGLVTLADEIKNVRDYFTIQRFRFGERIDLQIAIPADDPLQSYRLPKLVLQPLVENAIIHGLEERIQGGKITINAAIFPNKAVITIEDNGKGMTYNELTDLNRQLGMQIRADSPAERHGGIAVNNVNDRLRLVYGQEYGLTYYSMPQIGTTVEIVLPSSPCEEL